jgi:hypothetical protein
VLNTRYQQPPEQNSVETDVGRASRSRGSRPSG